ncbi:MFS transporter [Loigolactobacillus backii]|uniref:MFS transporter n=1 Tax=Loigolactobacillus backii TaxID=375175 RepID=A0A192H2G2_9LACO|nr:MFS transporter [Loigolactobacillus backii]ANK62131.1 MFS transporter [Loigolactobacillus backii]ANK68674.1 MFS transporter [Loigolactobacillus backii]MDA5386677.1 MFS transporter [Loigolactobacillus backii]MDA5389202.1 MFS transporter [Loigolactobacillus backii]
MQEEKPKTRRLLVVAGLAWLFDAMDVGMLSFIIAALKPEWHLSEVQMGWIGSVSSIGMAVGAILFGILADRYGRKDILIITLLFFSIGTGLSALTTGYVMFLVLRFIIGMGLGGELPVASTLVSENVPVERRGRTVVLLESFWAGGWLVAALISYFVIPTWGWRVALLGSALTAFYALYLRYGLHESQAYVQQTLGQRPSTKTALADLWKPAYFRSTLMLWIVWFMVVFSYYGMFLWLPSVLVLKGYSLINSFGYTLIMTLAQLPGYFVAAWLVERLGRKKILSFFLLGTAVSALGFGNATGLPAILSFGMLLSFFNLGAWGTLYAYSPEQYPLVIRGTGTGIAAGIGRIGGILGPIMVGSLIAKGVSFTYIFGIFCAAIIIAVIAIIFLGKETMGQQLDKVVHTK